MADAMCLNDLQRFKAVAHFEQPDYIPIFGFPGAPGMSWGCMRLTHERLLATGMPDIGGSFYGWQYHNPEGWMRYWGTTGPIHLDFSVSRGAEGFKSTSRIEHGFEIIECESGALTRQVLDNDVTYSMPEHVRYPVRDRDSWEFYKQRHTPREFMPAADLEANCRRFDNRTKPLCIGAGSTYGTVRGLMGTEAASLALHDDPDLVHDITNWHLQRVRHDVLPLIERLRPEIVAMGETHPDFVLFGWLEKEAVNEGNEATIKPEIMSKVPALLSKGGYFPNGDHGIQPPVTFPSLCQFMTLLHEVCGNPEGEFPRQ